MSLMNAVAEPAPDAIVGFAHLHRSGGRWCLRLTDIPEWLSSDLLSSLDKQELPLALICQYPDKALALELRAAPTLTENTPKEFAVKPSPAPQKPATVQIPPEDLDEPQESSSFGLEALAASPHKDAIIANVVRIALKDTQSPSTYLMQALDISRDAAVALGMTIIDQEMMKRVGSYSKDVAFTEAQVAIMGEKPKSQRKTREPMSEEAKAKLSAAQKARWERFHAGKAGGAE